jgi:hypothetical protein
VIWLQFFHFFFGFTYVERLWRLRSAQASRAASRPKLQCNFLVSCTKTLSSWNLLR